MQYKNVERENRRKVTASLFFGGQRESSLRLHAGCVTAQYEYLSSLVTYTVGSSNLRLHPARLSSGSITPPSLRPHA
jgi:hypothetical protein